MKFYFLTLFPQMIKNYVSESIMKRAIENGIIHVKASDIREYSQNKHKKVDDYPYGGGAGMVMTPQPIYSAYEALLEEEEIETPYVVYLSPKGRTFDQGMAKELSKRENIIFLCGHYEGIDQRIIDSIVSQEISIGDYVLTGGELASLVVMDAVARMIPGVLGEQESFEDESFMDGLLEYPHYTRPKEFMGMNVPDVLLSGNHREIKKWREEQSYRITTERRPDILKKSKKCLK